MSIFRGFIAIDIHTTSKIIAFEKEIKETDADVKLVEPENIHVTIKFLGDIDDYKIDDIERIMKESVQDIKPFFLTLKGTGVFPNQKYIKVLWIGIMDDHNLEDITNVINEKLIILGFKKENKKFTPHLTIGRVKTKRKKEQLLKVMDNYKFEEFTIQKIQAITLKKSKLTPKGPIYTTLRTVFF